MCGIASSRWPIVLEVLGRQHVEVAAGDHDVLDLGARGDVGDGGMPALRVGLQAGLLDGVGVAADRVAARAEAAIDRADVERQEQRLVVVAVRQAGRRRIGLLVERVERQARVIGQLGRGDRQELDAERIAIRIGPVDQGDDVGRDPHVHRRAGDAGADVVEEGRRHAVAEHRGELVEARDAVLVLELPVQEGGAIDVGVAGDLPPELVVAEVAVGVGLGIDDRLEGGGHLEIHQLGQQRVCFHPRQDVADAGGDIDLIDKDIGGLAHGGVFFNYGESGVEGGARRMLRWPVRAGKSRSNPVKYGC